MGKLKVFIYLTLFLITTKVVAQVVPPIDTASFRFERDISSTLNIRCRAQYIISGDTAVFTIADTAKYTFTWGGDIAPDVDGLPLAHYQFTTSGIYTFTLSVFEKSTGKTFTESKTFNILGEIIVPNVFTPNFDGINDLFIVKSDGIRTLEISVYSRTGTLVYQSKSPIIVWDGRNSSGQIVSPGIYYYILTSDEPEPRKGFFYILYKESDIKGK